MFVFVDIGMNFQPLLFRGDFRFVDIFGFGDHHHLDAIIRFVVIGEIVDHHCLEVIVCIVDIGMNFQPPLFRGDCSLC